MKKLAVIGGILLLTAVAYPAFAWGPGCGGGYDGYGPGLEAAGIGILLECEWRHW